MWWWWLNGGASVLYLTVLALIIYWLVRDMVEEFQEWREERKARRER